MEETEADMCLQGEGQQQEKRAVEKAGRGQGLQKKTLRQKRVVVGERMDRQREGAAERLEWRQTKSGSREEANGQRQTSLEARTLQTVETRGVEHAMGGYEQLRVTFSAARKAIATLALVEASAVVVVAAAFVVVQVQQFGGTAGE